MADTFPLHSYDDIRVYQRRNGILEFTEEARYLDWRGLNIDRCIPYVRTVRYIHGKAKPSALGFRNEAGGWELRRKAGDDEWQGVAGARDVSLLPAKDPSGQLLIFAHFPELLTYLSCLPEADPTRQHYLVLNHDHLTGRAIEVAQRHDVRSVQVWTPGYAASMDLIDALADQLPGAEVGTMEHAYHGYGSLIEWRAAQLRQPGAALGQMAKPVPGYKP
ncbi:hypothetical protein GCM10027347_59250 [Larkinella harenae]